MDKKVVTTEMLKKLKEPLPKEAISRHPTKPYLSTIKAIYVVERLNDVFELGNWFLTDEIIEKYDTQDMGKKQKTMIIVKARLQIPEYNIDIYAYGGNDNEDRGDAYKGAVTDALTKICSYLYIGIDVFKGIRDEVERTQFQKTVKSEEISIENNIDEEVDIPRLRTIREYIKKLGLKKPEVFEKFGLLSIDPDNWKYEYKDGEKLSKIEADKIIKELLTTPKKEETKEDKESPEVTVAMVKEIFNKDQIPAVKEAQLKDLKEELKKHKLNSKEWKEINDKIKSFNT